MSAKFGVMDSRGWGWGLYTTLAAAKEWADYLNAHIADAVYEVVTL